MHRTLVICDDFRIGGIQRIALDQAYELNRRGISSEILVLSEQPDPKTPTFQKNEKDLIEQLSVKVTYISGKRLVQARQFFVVLQKSNYDVAICYSLRGVILLSLLRQFSSSKTKILITIEQLPSMSAPVQRVRRIFYSQFSDKLFIFSAAAKKDWNYRRKSNPFIRLISSRRKIELCRNGVYLPRLPFAEGNFDPQDKTLKRFVFVGRLTAWKGLGTVLDLAQMPQFKNVKVLLVTPSDPKEYLANLEKNLVDRITCVVGKSISQIDFCTGDLHLYPANYGANSQFVEGVSINVLEMACLGVPSLITRGGAETWPELVDLRMITEVDWSDLKSVAKIIEQAFTRPSITAIEQSRAIIDVGKNVDFLLGN